MVLAEEEWRWGFFFEERRLGMGDEGEAAGEGE
jgi:hypothetical protein